MARPFLEDVKITKKIRYWDLVFFAETAKASRSLGNTDVRINVFRDYGTTPIKSKKEIAENRPLFNFSKIVKEIRKRRDKAIQESLGIKIMPDFILENRIEKESSRDEYLYKRAVRKLAGLEE